MNISVIIPTYKRPKSLVKTLQSLQGQTYKNFEIIIVDNAGDPETHQEVKAFQASSELRLKLITHLEGGNSAARNRGVLESRGELLLFTDDDVAVSQKWVEAYEQKFREFPEMAAAGGCVKPLWEEIPPEWLSKYLEGSRHSGVFATMDLSEKFELNQKNFFFSNNMALRRDVFHFAEFQPEKYGDKTIGSGESGLLEALKEKGFPIGYLPDAVVYHHIPKERMSVKYIRKWAWHLGGCVMYQKWQGRQYGLLKLSGELFKLICASFREVFRSIFIWNHTEKEKIQIQFLASLGVCKIIYLWWMLSDSKVQEALKPREFGILEDKQNNSVSDISKKPVEVCL